MNLQAQLLGLRAELAGLQVSLSLIKLIAKHNFNPNEPRIPAGQPGGGQWTGVGQYSPNRRLQLADQV